VLSNEGSSCISDILESSSTVAGASAVHTVIMLHTPPNSMIIVSRGARAVLVSIAGIVLRVFSDITGHVTNERIFVAAAVSASNRWLYAVREDGSCCVFDVANGKLERVISGFGKGSTSSWDGSGSPEVSAVVRHPNKSMLAAFSSSKSQKRGQLAVWR
jgi:hypothetical protein